MAQASDVKIFLFKAREFLNNYTIKTENYLAIQRNSFNVRWPVGIFLRANTLKQLSGENAGLKYKCVYCILQFFGITLTF